MAALFLSTCTLAGIADTTSAGEDADLAAEAHDHSSHAHADEASGWSKVTGWIGKFHPPAVNFPIALIVAGAVAEVLLIRTGRRLFRDAGYFCVVFGAAAAIAAAALGWCLAGFRLADDEWPMTFHRWLGTSTALWSVVLLWTSIRGRSADPGAGRTGYRVVLFLGVALVSVTGFFGGALLYGLDHYAW